MSEEDKHTSLVLARMVLVTAGMLVIPATTTNDLVVGASVN